MQRSSVLPRVMLPSAQVIRCCSSYWRPGRAGKLNGQPKSKNVSASEKTCGVLQRLSVKLMRVHVEVRKTADFDTTAAGVFSCPAEVVQASFFEARLGEAIGVLEALRGRWGELLVVCRRLGVGGRAVARGQCPHARTAVLVARRLRRSPALRAIGQGSTKKWLA